MAQPLIAVVGATATGKSGLAIQIAQQLEKTGAPGEIINADSMQFYRGMNIGTAKITESEAQGVPHHLLDTLEVTEEASVATYQDQAREVIEEVRARGNTPILVGGSGLYVRAALDIIEFPPTDPRVRAELATRAQREGIDALKAELAQRDPESAATINDHRRLIRALEVVHITGRSFTSYMPTRTYHPPLGSVTQLALRFPRPALHHRISTRVHQMVDQGLEQEVTQLLHQGLRKGKTASRAIGYQQFVKVADGQLSVAQATEDTIVATRKLARRQETWFRADPRIRWLSAEDPHLLSTAMNALA